MTPAGETEGNGIRIEHRGCGVTALILASPERRNALHGPCIAALNAALVHLSVDVDTRVIVFAADGQHFSVGGDLNWMGARDADALTAYHADVIDTVRRFVTFPKPVLAAVRGACAGGAMGFALAADYVLAADDAVFSAQFLRIGLVPDCALIPLLTNRVGVQRARRIIFDDRRIDARDAAESGMIDGLVAVDKLDLEADALARRLARMPRIAFAQTKSLLSSAGAALDGLLEAERAVQAGCLAGEEFREGVAAFKARRDPKFL